jgi:hypothetical protein
VGREASPQCHLIVAPNGHTTECLVPKTTVFKAPLPLWGLSFMQLAAPEFGGLGLGPRRALGCCTLLARRGRSSGDTSRFPTVPIANDSSVKLSSA